MTWTPPLERGLIALSVLLLVALPTALHGWPTTLHDTAFTLLLLGGGFALAWWRARPRLASLLALGLLLGAAALDGWFPDTGVVVFAAGFAVLALGWSGRRAWLVAGCGVLYIGLFSFVGAIDSWVATLMFTVPPYAAGTALRLHRETSDQLALRARELEEERELFAEISIRHERSRIAAELHDVVGHAISVMVIQAAAGQRLAVADPVRARAALGAIADSARQGSEDLERLVLMLGGSGADEVGPADLALVDEVVARAGQSGLSVTCRFEGDRDRVSPPVAHLTFRVVQESLTNALRHAPGADVRIVIRVEETSGELTVRVSNGRTAQQGTPLVGTARGLIGLRERARFLGGTFTAGPTGTSGWAVEARLPAAP